MPRRLRILLVAQNNSLAHLLATWLRSASFEQIVVGKFEAAKLQLDMEPDLLVTELKIAAGRTNVSSVPAFLTEHLRRRLWKKDRRQVEEEGKSASAGREGAVKVDASQCPDCFGTGMWYPEGFERGVARCGHEKLTAGSGREEGKRPEGE